MRTLLIDADITAFSFSSTGERAIDWGDGMWTLHSDVTEVRQQIEIHLNGLLIDLEADQFVLTWSDSDRSNIFRRDILPDYKANRSSSRKPVCLPEVTAWMKETYQGYERPRLEGDDILGILATSEKIIKGEKIIVSLDKDMKTVPGFYYRTSHPKEGIVEVPEEEADYWHLFQTLTGDTTDNYKGCPGVGPKKAGALLDEDCSWDTVLAAYEKAKVENFEHEALVQAQCARILRNTDYDFKKKEPILWTPDNLPDHTFAGQK